MQPAPEAGTISSGPLGAGQKRDAYCSIVALALATCVRTPVHAFGRIPILAFVIRNDTDAAHIQRLAKPLIIAEQEEAILFQRAAGRASELISAKGRNDALIERPRRIERAVSQKFKNRAMKLVRPGLRDDADLRPGALSVFGGIGVREHVKFADGIHAQQIAARSAGSNCKLARSHILDAVQEKQIFAGAAPGHGKSVPVARAGVGAFHGVVIDRAGIEGDQIVEAAAVERQFLDLALVDDSGNG